MIRIRAGARLYTHTFKPISQAEWELYAKGAGTLLLQEGNAITPQGGDEEPAWEFWARNVLRVEGYTQAGIAEQAAGWKEFVPATHQLYAVEMLREVFAVELSDDGEHTLVRLEAGWNGAVHERLMHRFNLPGKQQVVRYRRSGARFLRVGGARKEKTQIIIPSRLGEICKLYDELIVAVDGYANAAPGVMDALHKSTAVNALFDPRAIAAADAPESPR